MAKAVLDRFNEVYDIAGSGSKLAKLGIKGEGANRLKDKISLFKKGIPGKEDPLYSAIELAVNTTPDNVKKVLMVHQFPFLDAAAATVQLEDMVWDTDFIFTESTKTEETKPTTNPKSRYKGGFDSSGKGTPDGDGKDKAMREVADAFIGELEGIFKDYGDPHSAKKHGPRKASSTQTSALEIGNLEKISDAYVVNKYEDDLISLRSGKDSPKVVMLARNGEFKNRNITDITKELIKDAHDKGAVFVVGDMPGVDSQFIDYLQEIGASFTVYHTGSNSRIQVEETTPVADSVVMSEQAEPIDSILTDTAKYLKLEIESIDFMMTTKEEDVFIKEFFEKYSQADITKAKQTLNCQGK
jgi:hypothetical protein